MKILDCVPSDEHQSARQFYLKGLRAYLSQQYALADQFNRTALHLAAENQLYSEVALSLLLKLKLGSVSNRSSDLANDFSKLKTLVELLDNPDLTFLFQLLKAESRFNFADTGTVENFDLVLDVPQRRMLVRESGPIDLGNQHILIELLTLFCKFSESVLSKQLIAETIWGAPYLPTRHDNLIYVNLRRLRVTLGKAGLRDSIRRTKIGYVLNPNLKVKMVPATKNRLREMSPE